MTDPRTQLQQIRERAEAATGGPWRAAYEESNCWYSITGSSIQHDGITYVCPEVATVEEGGRADATFIGHARTDVPRLVDALSAVLDKHSGHEEQVVNIQCANGECDHEGDDIEDCPTLPMMICRECYELAEQVDDYFMETQIHIVKYPCPTVQAITAAMGGDHEGR